MSGNLRRHAEDMAAHGQSLWHDGISRGMLLSGEIERLVSDGVTGLMTNPSIFCDAIEGDEYDQDIASAKLMRVSPEDAYEQIVAKDVGMAATILADTHRNTGGADGFVSMEISPLLERADEMVLAAMRMLFFVVGSRSNVMVKVPSTPEGIAAGRELLQRGVHVNFTLLFSVEAYRSVIAAHGAFATDGTESVASFFVRRLDAAVDALADDRKLGSGAKGVAGVAGCRAAYAQFEKAKPMFHGSRPQRLLWANTSANCKYEDVYYPRRLMARDTVITLSPDTMSAMDGYDSDLGPAMRPDEHALRPIASMGIDMSRIASSLLAEGLERSARTHRSAVDAVRERMGID